MANAGLVENGRAEDVGLTRSYVERIDRCLVDVGMHGENVDVHWPGWFYGRRVRGGILTELGSDVEANARKLLLRPGLDAARSLDLNLDAGICSHIVGIPIYTNAAIDAQCKRYVKVSKDPSLRVADEIRA